MTATGSSISRRTYLRAVGATSTTTITGLAGCIGGGSSVDELRVAYMPIYPDMQYFVMDQEGYFDELDVEIAATQFPDGPSIVQAFGSGKFDVAMFGVVPSLVVIDKDIAARIVAANIKDAMGIIASNAFGELWAEHGANAFDVFREREGRKFKFGTFPPGSVPDILLRYWLAEVHGLDVDETVDVVPMGAGKVRQALLAGEIDGTSIMEPIPTIAKAEGAPYSPIAIARDFFPGGQPAAVVLMHDRIRVDAPEVGRQFLAQHKRATAFANDNPDAAADHASTIIGKDVLPPATAKAAMRSPLANFISDAREIAAGTEIYSRFAHDLGKLDSALGNDEIFDFNLYDDL